MDTPLEITFTNLDRTDRLDALVSEKTAHLEKTFGGINSCHVHVSAPHRRQKKGNLYGVRIEVRVPGTVLYVDSGKDRAPEHEHAEVAIRDAFHAMERRLKEWKQRASHDVKTHDGQLQGRIAEIRKQEGYGQILATDQRLVYFHRNSVVGGRFDDLQQDDAVELVVDAEESASGPQASTVRPIGAMKYTPG